MPLKTLWARLLVNMLSISVAEYEVRRVGLEMRGRKACENKLSINSWDGTWWLYWRRFRLKSPITEQCLLSLEISERILLNLSIKIAVFWFGGLYTQPTMILFPWGTIISKKSDSITSGSENLHSSRSLYSRSFCKINSSSAACFRFTMVGDKIVSCDIYELCSAIS